jgi:uncharacterized membrane protein
VQQGLWFIPSVMTCLAAALAFIMIRLDQGVLADRNIRTWWFFEGGAEGARGVLTAIASTMITVATTVFSITIVALQLAASQFFPRVLRGFTRDRWQVPLPGVSPASLSQLVASEVPALSLRVQCRA